MARPARRYGPRTIVLADKAYDADRIRELIQDDQAASWICAGPGEAR